MSFLNSAKSVLLLGAVALLIAPPVDRAHSAPAPRNTGACSPTKVRYALSNRDTATTSTNPVTIVDTAVRFIQARAGCVIVDFTSKDGLDDPPPGTMFIRATLKRSDGTVVSGRPSGAQLNFTTGEPEIRTLQFVFPDVTPGNYLLRMQVESSAGGGVVVSAPNTVVHYN
jgi:hypothetical protein